VKNKLNSLAEDGFIASHLLLDYDVHLPYSMVQVRSIQTPKQIWK